MPLVKKGENYLLNTIVLYGIKLHLDTLSIYMVDSNVDVVQW